MKTIDVRRTLAEVLDVLHAVHGWVALRRARRAAARATGGPGPHPAPPSRSEELAVTARLEAAWDALEARAARGEAA